MPLRILHLEDNPADVRLVQIALEEHGIDAAITDVGTANAYFAALEQGDFDLILSDVCLPGFNATSAMQAARERCGDIPFIVISGGEISDLAAAMYRNAGAFDYVSKQNLSQLVDAVESVARRQASRH